MEIKVSGNPLMKIIRMLVFLSLFLGCGFLVSVGYIITGGGTETSRAVQVPVAARVSIPTPIPAPEVSEPALYDCEEGEIGLNGYFPLPQNNGCGWNEGTKLVYIRSKCCRPVGPGSSIVECPRWIFDLGTINVCY